DSTRGADAAKAMRVTAQDALALGLIDEVIPEPIGGAHRGPEATAAAVRDAVHRHLEELTAQPIPDLLKRRQDRLRSLGRIQPAGLK
ncbi:MAG: hypothetical protein SFU56_20355, partial [Capsulimonadales bacterium]|nr:hypothetical protein [Capsulimonadales bacterium]